MKVLAAALESVFGPDTETGGGPAARAWAGTEASAAPVQFVRGPGRVNLMGDHTDYNDGFVLPVAVGLDTWIAYRRRRDGLVRMMSRHLRDVGSFRIDELAPSAGRLDRPWIDYVAGVAWSLRESAQPIRGFDGVMDTTIPVGAGLADSAALELAAALALLGDGDAPSAAALAALAQRAEREYVGIDCGIVDQLASSAGREDRALLIDCRSLDSRYVALPFGVRVVVCDTGARPDSHSAIEGKRRAECSRAVALLSERMPGLTSLRDLDAASLRRHRALLPDNVARRAEHVVGEDARVLTTAAALDAGDLDELARLFAESHTSLRDLCEVSSPELDTMVEVALAIPGVVAARMTGSGSGGCTVNLVLADAVPALQAAVAREYDSRTGLRGRVYPVAIVDGAGPVVVA